MKKDLKIIAVLLFVLTLGFMAGCSDEVTRPQIEPAPDLFTVDATATPTVVTVGHFVTLHADGRDGISPYSFRWYQRGEWIGVGEEPAPQQMSEEGFYTFLVVGTDALGAVAEDSVIVTVLPAEPEPLSIDLEAIPTILEVGNYTYLHTHVVGGAQPYWSYTFYKDGIQMADNQVGWFRMLMYEQGNFNFRVRVIDAFGITASDSIIVSVVAPNIIETCLDLGLKVGPYYKDDNKEVNLFQDGESNATIDVIFDTAERRIMILTLHYADGIESNFTIPDIGLVRPSVKRIYLGAVRRRIPIVRISLRWTGSPSKCVDKCTNWNSVTRICLSTEGPNKSADGIPLIILGKEGNYTILE